MILLKHLNRSNTAQISTVIFYRIIRIRNDIIEVMLRLPGSAQCNGINLAIISKE